MRSALRSAKGSGGRGGLWATLFIRRVKISLSPLRTLADGDLLQLNGIGLGM